MNISLTSLAAAIALPSLFACASPTVDCAVPSADDAPSLGLVMVQDFASPADVSLHVAWEAALRAPVDGLREQFPFIARGLPEGTEVRLMVERRGDGLGQEAHGTVVAARRTLRTVIAVDWFADHNHGRGGVRILPEGVEDADGLPVEYLCGSIEMWIEAEDEAGDLVTSPRVNLSRSAAECAETPRTF